MLARRNLKRPTACYLVYAPVETTVDNLDSAAGSRWAISQMSV